MENHPSTKQSDIDRLERIFKEQSTNQDEGPRAENRAQASEFRSSRRHYGRLPQNSEEQTASLANEVYLQQLERRSESRKYERRRLREPYRIPNHSYALPRGIVIGVATTVLVGWCFVQQAYFWDLANSAYCAVAGINNEWNDGGPVVAETVYPTDLKIVAPKSTITGIVDSETLTASFYWTFLLQNPENRAGEVIAELVIPKGSAVSRATLWVNGVAEEAAFSGTSNVVTAYEWVRNGRRDPFIVTWLDDERVQIKAAPVPVNGTMQVRLGITSPLSIARSGDCTVTVPRIEKSNFEITGAQDLHLESATKIEATGREFRVDSNGSDHILRANIPASDLQQITISTPRTKILPQFATRATHAPEGTYIVGTLREDDSNLLSASYAYTNITPNCPIINSESAAHRASNLWARNEIKRLLDSGDPGAAERIGSTYRLVSKLTGAVVLERQSDYERYSMNRDAFQTMAYQQYFNTANNGNVDSQIAYVTQRAPEHIWIPPISTWLAAPTRDANLFDGPIFPLTSPPPVVAASTVVATFGFFAWILIRWRKFPPHHKLGLVAISTLMILTMIALGIL